MMKKAIAVTLAAALALSVTACGGSSAGDAKKDRLAKIKEQGYIEMATEPYWAPNEFIDPSKEGQEKYVGVDIEIGKKIAEKLGVELRIVPLDFTAVLTSITEGKYDMAISAIAYSPTRAESMNLSIGYTLDPSDVSTYGFAVRAEDKDKYTTIESVKDAVITTQSGSVQEGLFNEFIGKDGCAEIKLFANMTDCYLAVTEGKADICICANASADLYGEANDGAICTTGFMFDADPELSTTRVGCPKGDSDSLMEVINEVLTELNESGQIYEWNTEFKEYAKSLGIE